MSLPTKPSADPVWATTPDAGNLVAPDTGKQAKGWVLEKPPLQYFNWWMNLVYQWLAYSDRRNPLSNMIKVTAAGQYTVPLGAAIYLLMDPTLGNQAIVLPTTTPADQGMMIVVRRISGGSNVLQLTGTVQGEVNPTVDYQHTERTLISLNGNWYWKE